MRVFRVLVVDDEMSSRQFIGNMPFWSKQEQFQLVAEAQTVDAGLHILQRSNIQIVLLDVFMPGRNGVELSALIAEKYPHISMIAISSYDNYGYVRDILKNGAHDYILKDHLSEETLYQALCSLRDRLEQPELDRSEQLRTSILQWVLHGGACPFMARQGRLAITVAWVDYVHDDKTPEVKNAVIQGILNIMQERSSDEQQIVAVYCEDNRFLICSLFPGLNSESTIFEILQHNNNATRDNLQEIYQIQIQFANCPLMPDYQLYPMIISSLLSQTKNLSNSPGISLTIAQRKAILLALEDQNSQATQVVVHEVYQALSDESGAAYLVTRELLSIAESAAGEYGIDLQFLTKREDLFEWVRSKQYEQLEKRIAGLYKVIIQQISGIPNYPPRIKAAIDYIYKHFKEPIGLEDVANHVEMNGSYLSRTFHRETGTTLSEYLNVVRIEHAKGYILTGMPLLQVSEQSGFSSYSRFSKVFRAVSGITPKQYLKDVEKNQR